MKQSFNTLLRFSGPIAAILAWITIGVSVYYNSWFAFNANAFSDLGGPRATNPWIYNYGLIVTAIFVIMYSLYLILDSLNKLEIVGGSFIFIAGMFLSLIGIYHAGTRPHVFVSTWFFIQMDLAILTYGLGLVLEKIKYYGIISIMLSIIGPITTVIIRWPSVAMMEAYGILIIDIWVFLMIKVHYLHLK
ncbi:MAG: DUF998 domain-containing protein [Thermoprotei archaeon]|jgi:hypothetical membrane protein